MVLIRQLLKARGLRVEEDLKPQEKLIPLVLVHQPHVPQQREHLLLELQQQEYFLPLVRQPQVLKV